MWGQNKKNGMFIYSEICFILMVDDAKWNEYFRENSKMFQVLCTQLFIYVYIYQIRRRLCLFLLFGALCCYCWTWRMQFSLLHIHTHTHTVRMFHLLYRLHPLFELFFSYLFFCAQDLCIMDTILFFFSYGDLHIEKKSNSTAAKFRRCATNFSICTLLLILV